MKAFHFFSKKLFYILMVLFFAVAPKTIFAANIIMSASSGSVEQGKTVVVTVFVASPSASINAVSGSINYPSDKLVLQNVSSGGSILNQWLPPGASGPKTSAGKITFDGITLAGYQGSKGKLFTATFKMVGIGDAAITVPTSLVLANDGSGTDVTSTGRGVTITGIKSEVIPPPEKPIEPPVIVPEQPATVPQIVPVEIPVTVPEIVPTPIPQISFWDRIVWVLSDSTVWILILLGMLCIGIFFIAMTLSRIERRLAYLEGLVPPPKAPRKPRTVRAKKKVEIMSE